MTDKHAYKFDSHDTLPVQNTLLLEICIDLSTSMMDRVRNTSKLDLLKAAVDAMVKSMTQDKLLKRAVELGVISFASDVRELREPSSLEDNPQSIPLPQKADGYTKLGEGVVSALKRLQKRKKTLEREASTCLLRPILIILSDGTPCHSSKSALKAAKEGCQTATDLVVVPVSIGQDATSVLSDFGNVIEITQFDIGEPFSAIVSASKSSLSTHAGASFETLLHAAMSWSNISTR